VGEVQATGVRYPGQSAAKLDSTTTPALL